VWIAQTPPAGGATDPILDFVQYGVLGLIIIALLLGWLWAKPAVMQIIRDKERADERADRAEAQRDELLKQYEEKVLPVIGENTRAARQLSPLLEEVIRRLPDDRR
jgi:hypothetical protein